MPRQGAHSLSALRMPQEQLLTISLPLASGASGQLRAIRAPGYTRDGSMMPHQLQHLRATSGVPQVYIAIIASTGQARAIQAPGHAPDPGRVVGRQGRTITFIACR
jgi:hypothetical protein